MPDAVELTGEHLAIADVWDVAVAGRPAVLGETGRTRAAAARAFLEAQVGDHTYGVNTGFGRFVSQAIPPEQAADLQLRLLRSHACGVGDPYPDEVVRAAMLLRANTLAKGFSGARVETIELLLGVLGAGIVPHVPSRGSVGASGDLAPLAHLALPLVGEGEATVDGRRVSGAEALAAVGLSPITLEAKEGLSLINGTQFMTAMASLALVRAQRLARVADAACAMSVEALQATPTSFHPAIHAARPLAGQQRSAATLRALLDGSAIVESHRWCDKVQDAYSLRCAPQVHGASRDLLDHVERTVAVELNAATDNPLVLLEEELIVSNGNFHGQPIAIGLDCIAIACAELASISERRTERLVNPSLSDGLPPVPGRARGGAQLGLHDPAVRGRRARLREQVVEPSRVRRLDPDERGPGGSRLDGERSRTEGAPGRFQCGARAGDRAARGDASSRVPCAAGARQGCRRCARVRPDPVRARPGGQVTVGGHRTRGDRHPRRLAARRGRGRGRGGERVSDPPAPRRPYRGSAIVHAVLALVILVVAAISGGNLVKAVLVAAAYFVIATGWTWFRFRQRESRAAPPERHPSSNGSRRP